MTAILLAPWPTPESPQKPYALAFVDTIFDDAARAFQTAALITVDDPDIDELDSELLRQREMFLVSRAEFRARILAWLSDPHRRWDA